MILSIEFLQDVPIPQKGTTTSRKFFASDGWLITSLEEGRVRLRRHRNEPFSTTVVGVPFLLHEDAREPAVVTERVTPADLFPSDDGPSLVRRVDRDELRTEFPEPTPKKPSKKGKRS